MTSTTALTIGGLTAALLVLVANLHPWWTGKRELKQLASFGKGIGAAVLMAACPGGLLGWVHAHTGGVANAAGERAGSAGTGVGTSGALGAGHLVGLSAAGAPLVVVGVFLVYLAWKKSGAKDKKRIIGGVFVGSALLLTAGIAGALDWLPTALNQAGVQVVAAVQEGL
ncbi:hypothetical protein AB0904_27765 [Streptomyces sp. NPDC006684]|uniref:hypothetical protein n=1 Tax=Streptomyces sp. NPDC006684 TaxID=3154477 RepID=UPI003454F069